MKQTKATLKNGKPTGDTSLHQWIARGGDPKDFKGSKGVSSETVNNAPKK